MKILSSFLFFAVFTTILLLNSCDKYHAKKLAGIYSCKVDYRLSSMNNYINDSTYSEDIEIVQSGKFVNVLGASIHIDSLWKEKEYTENNHPNYLTVLFKNDKVFITESYVALGGHSSRTYEGEK